MATTVGGQCYCRSGGIGPFFVIMKCYLFMPQQRAIVIEFYIQ